MIAHPFLILGPAEPPGFVDVSELGQGQGSGSLGSMSLPLEIARPHGQMELEFVVHLGRIGSAERQAEEAAVAGGRHDQAGSNTLPTAATYFRQALVSARSAARPAGVNW
jgi:hypothetical protein